MVRTLACHARGQGFESPSGRQTVSQKRGLNASVAQLVEQGTENPRVVGSIPTGGTIADLAHLVERDLAKVEVAGSSPVIRSKKRRTPPFGGVLLFCRVLRGEEPSTEGAQVSVPSLLPLAKWSAVPTRRTLRFALVRNTRAPSLQKRVSFFVLGADYGGRRTRVR